MTESRSPSPHPVADHAPLRRRLAPVLALFFLSPLVAEFLLGNISIGAFWVLPVLLPLYGGGAVLAREIARRTGRGWPAVLLLALAYAVIEEGLVTQTLFSPSYFGFELNREAHIPLLGMGAWWALFVLTLHTVWSVAVPVALVEACVPADRAAAPWLGRVGLAVTSVVFALGAALNFAFTYQQERFLAAPAQWAGAVAVVLALVYAAFALPPAQRPGERADDPRPAAPRPWQAGAFAFLAASAFFVLRWLLADWPLVVAYLLLFTTAALTIARWSRRRAGWGATHRLAVAGGALLTYAWHAFFEAPIIGPKGTIDLIGNAVFALGAVALLAFAARRVTRSTTPWS